MTSDAPTVTAVRMYRASGGPELRDGDPIPVERGAQGGSHVGFELELDGSGFGSCANVRLVMDETSVFSGGIRVRETATGVRTTQLVVFPPSTVGCQTVVATAYGVTRVLRLGFGCMPAADAGPDAGPRCGDGVVQTGEECDLADRAVCRADCRLERCDGVAEAGEGCFVAEGSMVTDTVLAMASRTTASGPELVTAVQRTDASYALELRAPTLELISSYPLPFEPGAMVNADRDGDGLRDDVVILSADGTRVIEGRQTGALPFELLPEVALGASANPSLPFVACGVDSETGDDLLFATGDSVQLLGAPPSVWLSGAAGPVLALGCLSPGRYAPAYVATAESVTSYRQNPGSTVDPWAGDDAMPHERLIPIEPDSMFLGLGPVTELFYEVPSLARRATTLPSTIAGAWVERDGRTVLGLIDDAGDLVTAPLTPAASDIVAIPVGAGFQDIVGLGQVFVTHDGVLLYLWVPSA